MPLLDACCQTFAWHGHHVRFAPPLTQEVLELFQPNRHRCRHHEYATVTLGKHSGFERWLDTDYGDVVELRSELGSRCRRRCIACYDNGLASSLVKLARDVKRKRTNLMRGLFSVRSICRIAKVHKSLIGQFTDQLAQYAYASHARVEHSNVAFVLICIQRMTSLCRSTWYTSARCNSNERIFMSNEGKQVKVHYVGTLDDGTKFDSSRDRGEPLAFTCMAGQMIPGFDTAVRDMAVGDTVNVRLEPKDAYGERRMDMVQTLPIATLPGAEKLEVGQRVMLRSAMGQPLQATVTDKNDQAITFDMNHEMAGKALNFEIELLEAR